MTAPASAPPNVLNRHQMAERLGVTVNTLTIWVHEGRVPPPCGPSRRRMFWLTEEIDAWTAAGMPEVRKWFAMAAGKKFSLLARL